MREPRRLMRELKLPGFITFQLMVGGSVFAALVHPLFTGGLIYAIARGDNMWRGDNAAVAILGTLYSTTAIIGYFSSAFLGWLGLMRRGLLSTAWVLALTPLHWLLLSLAAWRAVYQLVVAPHAWEKTEHGLAKTSRRAMRLTHALVELERQLGAIKDSDKPPVLANAPPARFSTRARPRAAA
jgi:hypothetical protein